MHDFIVSPYFFGDFSVGVTGIGRRQFDEMDVPCGNLYFAGEGFSQFQHSTVHAGLIEGQEAATRIAEILRGPIQGK